MDNSIISAISRGCKGTLSDGTVRYVFDIEPSSAAAAAELFGMPGSPVALARLTPEAAQDALQEEVIADHQKRTFAPSKGGPLAKLAGMWCGEPKFWEWVRTESVGFATNQNEAAEFIRRTCCIESRAELDHNAKAARLFNDLIRSPYMAYLR